MDFKYVYAILSDIMFVTIGYGSLAILLLYVIDFFVSYPYGSYKNYHYLKETTNWHKLLLV